MLYIDYKQNILDINNDLFYLSCFKFIPEKINKNVFKYFLYICKI